MGFLRAVRLVRQTGWPIRLTALCLFVFLASTCVLAQPAIKPRPNDHPRPELLKPGIVVEANLFTKTGPQSGDVLLNWTRGNLHGALASPHAFLRLRTLEWGTVTVAGTRNGKKEIWEVPFPYTGAETRPNFSGAALARYRAGEELAKSGKVIDAVRGWQSLADDFGTGQPQWLRSWLLFRTARAWTRAQQWKEADEAYAAAINSLGSSDQVTSALLTFEWIGALRARGDLRAADAKCAESLARIAADNSALVETRESQAVETMTLMLAAVVAGQRGDLGRAEGYLKRSYEVELGLSTNGFKSLMTLGNIEGQHGNLAAAEAAYRRAFASLRRPISELDQAIALQNLAYVAHLRGDLLTAEKLYNRALVHSERAVPDSLAFAYLLEDCGLAVRDSDHLQKAETYFQKALLIERKFADESAGIARDLNHLGVLSKLRGNLEEAQDYLQQALTMGGRFFPETRTLAETQYDLADVLRKRGDTAGAEEHFRRALAILEKAAPDTTDHAETLAALAAISRSRGQLDEALTLYTRALEALDSQTARLGGRGEVRAGFRAKYENYYREYSDLLIARSKPETAFEILERSRSRTLLEILAAAHVDVRKDADPILLEKEHSLQTDIKGKSGRRVRLLSEKHTDQQIKAIEQEISDLTVEYQDVEAQIRSTSPAYAALTQPQPLSAKEIQEQLLDPDTLLLEYSLGEERSYVFAVTPDSLQAFPLPKRAEIDKAARRAYELLRGRNLPVRGETVIQERHRLNRSETAVSSALSDLSKMVVGPVGTQLKNKRLLIVADGALAYVPFSVLAEPQVSDTGAPDSAVDGGTIPLIVNHEIINLPSASVLAVLRQQQINRAQAPKAVAVLADPVFNKLDPRVTMQNSGQSKMAVAVSPKQAGMQAKDGLLDGSFATGLLTRSATEVGLSRDGRLELPRLRFSRQEADAILAVTPPGSGLRAVDFQASRATATSPELSQYRIVHFATHGLLNSEHPELSGLVLSLVDKNGKPQEGFLELQDIYNLNLPADLVVLSACETGLGKEISGEGLMGMTRGFMYAGASRVVASLWKVSDAATAQLMAEFYRAMEKDHLAPAAALRAAQVRMWKQKRWSSPYYWAAFQIQGEWK